MPLVCKMILFSQTSLYYIVYCLYSALPTPSFNPLPHTVMLKLRLSRRFNCNKINNIINSFIIKFEKGNNPFISKLAEHSSAPHRDLMHPCSSPLLRSCLSLLPCDTLNTWCPAHPGLLISSPLDNISHLYLSSLVTPAMNSVSGYDTGLTLSYPLWSASHDLFLMDPAERCVASEHFATLKCEFESAESFHGITSCYELKKINPNAQQWSFMRCSMFIVLSLSCSSKCQGFAASGKVTVLLAGLKGALQRKNFWIYFIKIKKRL